MKRLNILLFVCLQWLLVCGVIGWGSNKANAQVSGIVYRDYNASGSQDPKEKGVVGAVVNAYNAAGQLVGTATVQTIAGTYEIQNVSGKLRIEFSNLGNNLWDSPVGNQNATSVQFVTAPVTNINLGINRPNDYNKGNPSMITICYRAGVHTDFSGDPALVNIPYFNSGDSSTTAYSPAYDSPMGHSLAVPIAKLGCLWGLTYDRVSAKIFTSAFMKRHAGFGPHGSGAIYVSDTVGTDAPLLVDLNAVFGANTTGPDLHNMELDHFRDYKEQNGLNTIDAVSKTSLGGLAISQDGKSLYVMNLFDRKLYIVPTNNPSAANIQKISIPIPTGTKNPDDIRPFAVEQYQGVVYVGMVNSAESTQDSTDLKGYIYTFDPKTNTFSSEPFFKMDLNYERGRATPGAPQQIAAWRPWAKGFKAIPANVGDFNWSYPIYPQPLLVGLDFSDDGDLIIGLRDRYGDQMGNVVRSNPANNQYYSGVSTGDVLIATKKDNQWVLENNGQTGNKLSSHGKDIGSGPGGGEFFCDDYYVPFQNEISTGGVKVLAGSGEVVVGCIDPIMVPNSAYIGGSSSGGIRWFSTEDGHYQRGYRLFGPGHGGKEVILDSLSLGKSASLGDIELIAEPGPIEIGNRIWRDTNGNGIQDADENGIANVVVELWKNDVKIATENTNEKGEYYFHSFKYKALTRFTDVEIRLDTTQAQLIGLSLTKKDAGLNDAIDSDAKTSGKNAVITHQTNDLAVNDHRLDMGFQLCPVISKLTASNPVCINQTIKLTLEGTNLGSFSWSGPDSFSSTQQNPQVINATTKNTGTYSITVLNEGCSATATVSTQVKEFTITAESNSPICKGINLTLTASQAVSYSWAGPGNFSSTIKSPSVNTSNITSTTTGIYSVTATSSDGCTATATVSTKINTFTVTAESNSPICKGINLTLTASQAASYSWAGAGNFSSTIKSPSVNTSNITSTTTGIYSVTATSSDGCTATATVSTKINTFSVTAESNSPVCQGTNLLLTASQAVSYSWAGAGDFSSTIKSPSVNTSNITSTTTGIYSVTATSSDGCTATATISTKINTFTVTAESNSPVCKGNNLLLTASQAASYSWAGAGDFSSTIKSPSVNTSNITSTTTGIYSVTAASSDGCTATATVSTKINTFTVTAESNSPICKGSNLLLTASQAASYSWSGPGNFSSTIKSPSVNNVSIATYTSGIYSVTATSIDGCIATATVSTKINTFAITAESNSPVCQGTNLLLTASQAASYSWSGPANFSSTLRTPVISSNEVIESMSGIYSITATGTNGCTASTSISVKVVLSSASIAIKPVTCTGNVSNDDAILSILGAKPTDKYDISIGAAYNGSKTYNNATSVPINGILLNDLPNPANTQSYTVRIFQNQECYIDRTAILYHTECICPPSKCMVFYTQKTNK